jgi:hypothetical protein
MKETITWIIDGTLPDSETTVLVQAADGTVGEGFHDGELWRWASSSRIPNQKIKAWADLPEGVK